MRKTFATILAMAALIAALFAGSSGQATAEKWPAPKPVAITGQPVVMTIPLNATNGYHNNTFYSCTVDGRQASLYVRYHIWNNTGIRLADVDYDTNPAFLGNALRVDVELDAYTAPGYFTELSPSAYPWGNSSTSLDDVPSSFGQIFLDEGHTIFDNRSNPQMRVRFYGVGAGSVGGRCDDQYGLE